MKISKLYQLIVENTGEINRLTAKFGPSSEALNTFYFKKLRTKYSGGGFIKDTNEILRRFNTLQEWEAFLKPWLDREDYYNAKNRAKNFNELYNALSDKDMYSYDFVVNKDAQPENIKKILETEMSYDIIYNDDTWLVVTPFQPDLNTINPTGVNASKFFSKMKNVERGATWCVGWNTGSNYFGHYTKDHGPHYIIIKKGQTKYNIQLGGTVDACNKQDTGNKNLGDNAYNIFPPVIFNKIFEYAISKGFDKVKGKNLIQNFMSVLRQRNYNQLAQVVAPKNDGQEDKFIKAIINNDIEAFKTLSKTNPINRTFENPEMVDKFHLGTNIFTPLTTAYLYGRTEILQYLLTQVDININNTRVDMNNEYVYTPLFFILYSYGYGKNSAIVSKETNTTNLLLILNSDKANLNNEIYNGTNNVLGYLISEWTLFSGTGDRVEPFLYIVNILKDKINLNALIINRNLPLLRYLFSRVGESIKKLLPIFLNHPSIDINKKDNELYTVFSYLVSEMHREQLKYLLENSTKKIDTTGYKWLLRLVDNDPEITRLIETYNARG